MNKFKNTLEIFKLLNKSNCKECSKLSCMAFAADVFAGQKRIGDCPHVSDEVRQKYGSIVNDPLPFEDEFMKMLTQLKNEVSGTDLASREQKTGGSFDGKSLTLKVLGKDFSVCSDGSIVTEIHVNPWITIPVFFYILHASDAPVSGNWITFREMEGGMEKYGLYSQRCEQAIKKIADTYTDLFEDMVRLFNGKEVDKHYKSDISLVLHPLPKIPVLICYWKPEDGLESDLKIFFDSNAEDHLSSEIIYTLAAGLANMFDKIALSHGAITG